MVHYENRSHAFRGFARSLEHLGNAARRTPSGSWMIVLVPGILSGRHRAPAKRWFTRYRAKHPLFCIVFVFR
jgi:hypothetical protein